MPLHGKTHSPEANDMMSTLDADYDEDFNVMFVYRNI